MHTFFTHSSPITQGIIKIPSWTTVRDGLQRNLSTVVRFYQRNPTAVRSAHFLVRLLQAITVPQSQNLERYYDNVDAIALDVAMALKMTSSIYRGEVFDGVFYGSGNPEILIATTEEFDIFHAHQHWQHLQPVKVLRHALSDLALQLPDGRRTSAESGLAVLSINIPMLALQYRAFRLNEQYVTQGNESQRSLMQFIRMYVLPNMLYSHLDYALFNRMDNLEKGAPLGESNRQHAFFLTDYSQQVEQVQKSLLLSLRRVGKDFQGTLLTIPGVTALNMEQALRLPEIAETRQVTWALSLSRIPALTFLFRLSEGGGRTRNQQEVNTVLRSVLHYHNNHIFHQVLPLEVLLDTEMDIETMLALGS